MIHQSPNETASPRERRLARIVTLPAAAPGFLGDGHTAVEVVTPDALAASDPFILLMDDRVDMGVGRTVGGAHPHAGLETVTLMLEGSTRDHDEGVLDAGDAVWMTAGRGIIHGEDLVVMGKVRLLQLWVRMPKDAMDAPPSFEVIRRAAIPVHRAPGVEARLYSGSTGELRSKTLNHVPVTLVDIALAPHASFEQELPASYNGFAYVLDGELCVGDDGARITADQVGWLDRPSASGASVLRMSAGASGARVVLYAGAPQNAPLVHHGPFVAVSQQEIVRRFQEYRAGRFARMMELAAEERDDAR